MTASIQPPIKIGFAVPLTGVYGVEAHDQLKGAKLAIDEFNESRGWNGRFAELLVRDTRFDLELARRATEELIVADKADLIVGSLKSEDQVAMSHVCAEHRMVFNGISFSDALLYAENRHPYTFHEAMSFHMMGGAVGRYVFSRLGNRVAMLSVDADYGRHSERALLHVGKQIGVDFARRLYHRQGETDLRPHLEDIVSFAPQVLVLNSLGKDQLTAVRQCVEMGLRERLRLVVPNFSIAQMLEAGPDLYEGIVGSAAYYWKLEELYESSRAFNDRHRKAYDGTVAGSYGVWGYNGVRAVLEAVRLAESLDCDRVRQAMLALRADFCKGPQFYRRLDQQSVQSMVIIEAKPNDEITDKNDLFDILEVVRFVKERSFHVSREVA